MTGQLAKGILRRLLRHLAGPGAAAGRAENQSQMPFRKNRKGGSIGGFDKRGEQFAVSLGGEGSHPEYKTPQDADRTVFFRQRVILRDEFVRMSGLPFEILPTLQNAWRTALAGSGVDRRAHIHTLRHSYATHLLEEGIRLRN